MEPLFHLSELFEDLEQIIHQQREHSGDAKGLDELEAGYADLLRPARFVLFLLILLCRRRSWGSGIFGLDQCGGQRQQSVQDVELPKAATLFRLHESLDPCMAVLNLLLA